MEANVSQTYFLRIISAAGKCLYSVCVDIGPVLRLTRGCKEEYGWILWMPCDRSEACQCCVIRETGSRNLVFEIPSLVRQSSTSVHTWSVFATRTHQ